MLKWYTKNPNTLIDNVRKPPVNKIASKLMNSLFSIRSDYAKAKSVEKLFTFRNVMQYKIYLYRKKRYDNYAWKRLKKLKKRSQR